MGVAGVDGLGSVLLEEEVPRGFWRLGGRYRSSWCRLARGLLGRLSLYGNGSNLVRFVSSSLLAGRSSITCNAVASRARYQKERT